jgi:hypothetical protein
MQAMAGFAGGSGAAADGSNAGFVNVDTSQQPSDDTAARMRSSKKSSRCTAGFRSGPKADK